MDQEDVPDRDNDQQEHSAASGLASILSRSIGYFCEVVPVSVIYLCASAMCWRRLLKR
jgi:hypothetical protein